MILLSKRAIIRIISFITAFSLVIPTLVITHEVKRNELRAEIQNNSLRSIGDLRTCIESIKNTLLKGIYSSSSQMLNASSVKLASETSAARQALQNISAPSELLGRIYTYLAQVADFSDSLAIRSGSGGEITKKDTETLYSFIDYAEGIGTELGLLLSETSQGNIEGKENVDDPSFTESIGNTISTIDQSFSEYPTLVYDGPFSDHIMNKEALYIKGLPEVSVNEALKTAEALLGFSEDELTRNEDNEGNMPAYNFSKGETFVSITKNGGIPIYMMKDKGTPDINLSADEAEKKALEFLDKTGFKSLKKTYYEISDGICYINYAYTDNGVVYYPDLVKIGVCLEKGDVVSFDSRGYLVNHTQRIFGEVQITEAEAEKKLPAGAIKESVRMTVIPLRSTEEKLCYEFSCKGQRDENLLIYIDATTGEEVSVLILLINENGTLSM